MCEGCGDCSTQSNCVSVEPLETEFGTKRKINQSTCNKDFSCLEGFCPSFVTVENAKIFTKSALKDNIQTKLSELPEPKTPEAEKIFNVVVTGIGGTGVVTIGALIGMAAHIENKEVTVLDQIGLAQKGGAVLSHIKIAKLINLYIPHKLIKNLLICCWELTWLFLLARKFVKLCVRKTLMP